MFFILSKVLWFIAQPSSIVMLMVLAGFLLQPRPAYAILARRLVLWGGIAFLVLGFSPLHQFLIAPLEDRFERPDIDKGPPVTGIIILGGAEDGRADPTREIAGLNEAAERITEAVALARRLPNAKVVFSGGNGHLYKSGPAEATWASRLLGALGLPLDRIVLEDKSRNTWENALFTKAKIDPKPGERWLLVTSAFHMPRSIGCFRKAGMSVEPWPVDYRVSDPIWEPNGYYPDGLRRVDMAMREWIGLVAYYLVGHTSALFPK